MQIAGRKPQYLLGFLCLTVFGACNGDSSASGIIVEGRLIEAGGAGHEGAGPKHGTGETIEHVEICAFDECSTTDGAGQWGFVVSGSVGGSEVLFTIKGHGIDTSTAVNIPAGLNEVFLEFHHVAGGGVEAHHSE